MRLVPAGTLLTGEILEVRQLLSASEPFNVSDLTPGSVVIGESDQDEHPVHDGYELHVLPAATQSPSTVSSLSSLTLAEIPLADTFTLHSNPNARHTIYLDFTGHVTTNSTWNSQFGASLNTPVFSIDSSTSFSNTELQTIQEIWLRVKEDFLPFDVDVTTEEPPVSDLIYSSVSDERWGVRVAIGGTWSDWYGESAGGVAYRGSFNAYTDTPTFVFSKTLYNDAKYVAEAVSHEAGHTLGLAHDGRNLNGTVEGYYTGHGSGDTGWAPIMGAGYYQNLTQWSKGQYTSANNLEDDLAIISTQNGFGYRTDDYGSSQSTAYELTSTGNGALSISGIIERNDDLDLFSFTTTGGLVNLQIDPAQYGPNLDILATLLDESGNVIATSNPTNLLSASFSLTLAAGTYTLQIDGTGNTVTGSTYTDYGSLGEYSISGTIEGFGQQAPPQQTVAQQLASFTSSGTLRWLGDGAGMISTVQNSTYGSLKGTHSGDFDGDGTDEFMLLDDQGIWWLGEFSGSTLTYTAVSQWGAPHRIITTVSGDFNGDGKLDVAGLYDTGKWWVGLSGDNSLLTRNWASWSASNLPTKLFVGDYNGDGRDDLSGVTESGLRLIALSTGSSFSTEVWGQYGQYSRVDEVLSGDFDGDGDDDLLARYDNGAWWMAVADTTSFQNLYLTRWSGADRILQTRTGDFNGDQKLDVITLYDNGNWVLGLSNGSGIDAQVWGTWGKPSDIRDIIVGDYNGDGGDDIAVRYLNGAWWQGQSNAGSFQASKISQWSSGSYSGTFLVGNFDSNQQSTGAALPESFAGNTVDSASGTFGWNSLFVYDFFSMKSDLTNTNELSWKRWQVINQLVSAGDLNDLHRTHSSTSVESSGEVASGASDGNKMLSDWLEEQHFSEAVDKICLAM
ncbi:MAG: VCBS repeat-containing protein [Planctomycetaceae bacterium]|nr:VCBS repeat-containing protein [Planctomycetaceae bacterium]